jgi:oligoribonuclease
MTGLRPSVDRITEVAAIITDMNLREIATYESGVKHSKELLEELTSQSEWHRQQKSYTKTIIEHSLKGKSEEVIQSELIDFIERHIGLSKSPEQFPHTPGSLEAKGEIYLAGNSIGADRAFIDSWWPKVARVLHYRMIDVSSFKVWHEAHGVKKFPKKNKHRAIDDIRESIAEFSYYINMN